VVTHFRMIVLRCANGVVLFSVTRNKVTDSLVWTCINDSSQGSSPRTNVGYEQLLRDMATKAVALRGQIQQIADLHEVF
jgi:hypothetical protein